MSIRRSIEIDGFSHGAQPIPAASRVGPLIVTGGVYGLDSGTGTMPDDPAQQASLMFLNLRRILAAAGAGMEHIARMTVYVKTAAARGPINDEWLRVFPDAGSRPARHTLVNEHLAANMVVQCDAIAFASEAFGRSTPTGNRNDAAVDRLGRLDTPTVSDALDKLGLPGAALGLAAMTVSRRIAGRAITVKLGPPHPDGTRRHLGAQTIMAADPGDIVVVEHGRTDVSGWGGLLSRAALARGVAGVVIDGAFRDVDEARELDFPIFAKAAVPLTARGRVAEHSANEPVRVAGVAVAPGDLVLADGSGTVFLPSELAETIIAEAEAIWVREQAMVRAIEAGEPLDAIFGANYEDMLGQDTMP